MNLPKWISIVPFAGDASQGYWHITDTEYSDPGNTNVYAIAFDENGKPAFNSVAIQENGGITQLHFAPNELNQAQASFNMTGDSSFDPNRGETGPYKLSMFGRSDKIIGIGLPLKQHVSLRVTFQWTIGAVPILPPSPNPSHYVTEMELPGMVKQIIQDQWSK